MLLPARQVWYRILCKKITHGVAIHQMNIMDSPSCRLCNASTDDLTHFVTHCPFKNDIWSNILSSSYPQNPYNSNELLSFICTLTLQTYITTTTNQRIFYTQVSTILYGIWTHYWRFILDNQPFVETNVILDINKQLGILLSTPSTE